ncbi:MAG: NADH-quinone oxidoreductase subunit NuoN [Dermatophilus congolensis]|nr:NADH-quinone oxidoreductase subunit NuoN [Dermatophilus congolensis]
MSTLPALATAFTPSDVNLAAIGPVGIVMIAAFIGLLVEAFAPRNSRHNVQVALIVGSLVAAFVLLVANRGAMEGSTLGGAFVMDGTGWFLQLIIVLSSLLALVIAAERFGGRIADAFTPSGASVPGSPQEALAERSGSVTEIFPLALFSVSGMMVFVSAGDLLTMFVALEVLSLPLYVMTALARRRRLLSQEAGLKYFLLGSFASAFFLFGSALLFGFSGSVNIAAIGSAVSVVSGRDALLVLGILFVLIGLLFKIGAAPFHFWTPDVYQGAPTAVTGFMASVTKIAAFGALLRVVYVGFEGARWNYEAVLWGVAALTMIVGSVLTITQSDIKRMLAYSSVAHAGFILVGLIAFDRTGVEGVAFYLTAYALTTIAGFGLITIVRSRGAEATELRQWAGLGREHPIVAGSMAFVLLSFAGIPLTSGFTAKVAAFTAAIQHAGAAGVTLAVIGVLCSAVTAFVYFRLILLMFFSDRGEDQVSVALPSSLTQAAIALGVIATLVLGVFPGPVLATLGDAALFLR